MGPGAVTTPLSCRRLLALAVLALGPVAAGAAAPACVTIDGGAIELSWVTYCADGKKPESATASCSCKLRAARLAQVRVQALALGDGGGADACAGRGACVFTASVQSGSTGFIVPPGDYAIGILPLEESGGALGGPACVPDGSQGSCWQTPAQVRRTVVTGEVVSLGTLLIAVPDCPTETGCDPGVCPAATP